MSPELCYNTADEVKQGTYTLGLLHLLELRQGHMVVVEELDYILALTVEQ